MSIVPLESARFETMEQVADLKLQGISETQIAKQLGIKRKDVLELFNEYKDALSDDAAARDLARDHLYQMVKHYDGLIKKSYDLMDELETLHFHHLVAAQKNSAIKLIADLEKNRLDALQRAGLLESAELGDELAEAEEKQELLLSIIKEDVCPACRNKIATKIARLSGRVEPLDDTIIVEVVDG